MLYYVFARVIEDVVGCHADSEDEARGYLSEGLVDVKPGQQNIHGELLEVNNTTVLGNTPDGWE